MICNSDSILVYEQFTNKYFIVSHASIMAMHEEFENYFKKTRFIELKKPFLQKLYEMSGRGY